MNIQYQQYQQLLQLCNFTSTNYSPALPIVELIVDVFVPLSIVE